MEDIPNALLYKARQAVRRIHRKLAQNWRSGVAIDLTSDELDQAHTEALATTALLLYCELSGEQLSALLRCFGVETYDLIVDANSDQFKSDQVALLHEALKQALAELESFTSDEELARCSCASIDRPKVVFEAVDSQHA